MKKLKKKLNIKKKMAFLLKLVVGDQDLPTAKSISKEFDRFRFQFQKFFKFFLKNGISVEIGGRRSGSTLQQNR